MVPDDFVDDEAKKLLAEFGIEVGFLGQLSKPRDLARFAVGIRRGEGGFRLVFAYRLGDPEPFSEHVNDRGIDVVDALAKDGELRIAPRLGGFVVLRGVGHRLQG